MSDEEYFSEEELDDEGQNLAGEMMQMAKEWIEEVSMRDSDRIYIFLSMVEFMEIKLNGALKWLEKNKDTKSWRGLKREIDFW